MDDGVHKRAIGYGDLGEGEREREREGSNEVGEGFGGVTIKFTDPLKGSVTFIIPLTGS